MRAVRTVFPCDHTERTRTSEYTTIGLPVLHHLATGAFVCIIPSDIIPISIDKVFEYPDSWRGCKDDWGHVDGGPYSIYENKDNPYAEPTQTLRLGDTGEGVQWVQWQMLHRQRMGGVLSHADKDESGKDIFIPNFDEFLEERIKRFQKLKNLAQTGIVDENTRNALKAPYKSEHNLVADAGNYKKSLNPIEIENDCPKKPNTIDGGWYQFDPSEAYTPDLRVFSEKVDYTVDLDNRLIEWNIDMTGFVGGIIGFSGLFTFKRQISHKAADCPQCLGQNWFTDLFNPEFKTFQVTGKDKLTQDYMKALLTDFNRETGYGSTIRELVGSNIYGVDTLAVQFTQGVVNCTERFIHTQNIALRTGQLIPDNELLEDVEITNLKVSVKDGAIFADLRLYARNGEQSSFCFQL